jgi:hypothetical protein
MTAALAGFKGWDRFPVDVSGCGLPSGYAGLVVRGRCGVIDDRRSVRMERIAPHHPKGHVVVWKGLYFDAETWDGSDIFCPEDANFIFVTERLAAALRAANLTNISLKRASDIERSAASMVQPMRPSR